MQYEASHDNFQYSNFNFRSGFFVDDEPKLGRITRGFFINDITMFGLNIVSM